MAPGALLFFVRRQDPDVKWRAGSIPTHDEEVTCDHKPVRPRAAVVRAGKKEEGPGGAVLSNTPESSHDRTRTIQSRT